MLKNNIIKVEDFKEIAKQDLLNFLIYHPNGFAVLIEGNMIHDENCYQFLASYGTVDLENCDFDTFKCAEGYREHDEFEVAFKVDDEGNYDGGEDWELLEKWKAETLEFGIELCEANKHLF